MRRTDGRTGMTKLIVAFRNFAKALNGFFLPMLCISVLLNGVMSNVLLAVFSGEYLCATLQRVSPQNFSRSLLRTSSSQDRQYRITRKDVYYERSQPEMTGFPRKLSVSG
jgi:hypothetical protein